MKKLKLMTIVGTRPEIIKMSAIIKKADKYLDHVLVHTVKITIITSMRYSLKILVFVNLITT